MKRETLLLMAPTSKFSDGQRFCDDGGEAVVQFDLGGAQVGFVAGAVADADQRVHFLGTEAHHAARAVILEAAAEDALAIGQHRRGERVAGEAGQRLAVEGEVNLLRRGRSGGRLPAGDRACWS